MKKAIYFGAEHCGQCRVFKPQFEARCKELGIPYEIKDAEEESEEATKYGVRNIPYVVAFKDDNVTLKGMAADVIPLLEKL